MATYTLTTTAQEVGRNTNPTVGARLLAWYSNQSGNSATVHLKLQAISQGTTYTGTNKDYELTLGDVYTGVVSWTYAPLPSDQWVDVREITKTVNGGTTLGISGKVWTYVFGDAWITGNSVKLDNFSTPPTGLSVSDIRPSTESFTATVSITGWGTGSGTRYRELNAYTYSSSGLTEPRRYQPVYGNDLSGDITVDNTSNGALNITGNTRYVIAAYATNGAANTGVQRFSTAVTLAYAPSLSATPIDDSSVLVTYSLQADGGFYAKNVQYSLDGGTTWVTGATINTGSATTGTFVIGNLSPNTAYNVKTRVSTTAGETNGNDISFTTLVGMNFLGPVNSKSKSIIKFYAPINRKSKIVKKLYGPDENGKSKLFYQA